MPEEIRDLLVDTGTPSPVPGDRIGPLPDLLRAFRTTERRFTNRCVVPTSPPSGDTGGFADADRVPSLCAQRARRLQRAPTRE
jgi:hypothetical protein